MIDVAIYVGALIIVFVAGVVVGYLDTKVWTSAWPASRIDDEIRKTKTELTNDGWVEACDGTWVYVGTQRKENR